MEPPPLAPLTAEEIRAFVRRGFLVKRGVLSRQGCAAARDLFWQSNHCERIRRNEPSTWVGGVSEDEAVSLLPNSRGGWLTQRGASWVFRKPMGCKMLLDLVPRRVMPWLEQLLGAGCVQQPLDGAREDPARGTGQSGGTVVRGIYGRLPQPATEEPVPPAEAGGNHVDPQPAHLIVTAHIDRLSPGSGGTLLWPGSHRLLHAKNPLFSNLMAATAFREWENRDWEGHPYAHCVWSSPQLHADYAAVRQWVAQHLRPFEFCGGEGDVVLWHARCFHAGSRNFSGASPVPEIRQAVFYDCHRADMLTADRVDADNKNLWAEWSKEVRALAVDVESEDRVVEVVKAVKAASVPRL